MSTPVKITADRACSGPHGLHWARPGDVVDVDDIGLAAELLRIDGLHEYVPPGQTPVLDPHARTALLGQPNIVPAPPPLTVPPGTAVIADGEPIVVPGPPVDPDAGQDGEQPVLTAPAPTPPVPADVTIPGSTTTTDVATSPPADDADTTAATSRPAGKATRTRSSTDPKGTSS